MNGGLGGAVDGYVGGIGLTWLLLPFITNSWAIALAVTLLTFLIETAIARHYAFAAFFITPLTILLAESSSPGSVSSAMLMQTRLIDTVVGALIGLVGAVRRFTERGLLRSNFADHEGSVDGNRQSLRWRYSNEMKPAQLLARRTSFVRLQFFRPRGPLFDIGF